MTYYNKLDDISKELNNSKLVEGYSRDDVLIKHILLDRKGGIINDAVKLAAAKCLSTVPLGELDRSEIRNIISVLTRLPTAAESQTFEMMSYLLYLLFTMAMIGLEEKEKDDAKEDSTSLEVPPAHECGETFRAIYSTEVVQTIYSTVHSIVIDDTETLSLGINLAKHNFKQALVKLLQTGWKVKEIGRAVQQECRDRSRMPSSA
eukprot:TRINITY_DN18993_c0_g1_i13.p1 TRINITY_DN18993_c0_g1~~TRINITY_DN18993_c0_g1_i13.p1  ORF type:complete len:205 (-),score=36.48 TRINITY_DN18993_c0_g1_i13:11-625(-)